MTRWQYRVIETQDGFYPQERRLSWLSSLVGAWWRPLRTDWFTPTKTYGHARQLIEEVHRERNRVAIRKIHEVKP